MNKFLAPPPGFEPGTFGLTVRRSTAELQGIDSPERNRTSITRLSVERSNQLNYRTMEPGEGLEPSTT